MGGSLEQTKGGNVEDEAAETDVLRVFRQQGIVKKSDCYSLLSE